MEAEQMYEMVKALRTMDWDAVELVTCPGCGRALLLGDVCPECGPVDWDWWGERVYVADEE